MRRITAACTLIALALIGPAVSGCTMRVIDPAETSASPASGAEPEAQPRQTPTAEEQHRSTAAEDLPTGFSDEAVGERQRLIDAATTTMPCPDGALDADGTVIRIEGSCDELVIHVDAGAIIADDVGSLTLTGSGTTIYVTDVDSLTVTGSASAVLWAGKTPEVSDSGTANTLRRG